MKFNMLKWISQDVAIDLGTANTLVYVRGKGIVMNVPSIVAVDTHTHKILAIGEDAKEMIGMTPGRIKTIRPLKEGVVADFRLAETMLRYLLKKIMRWHVLRHPRMVIAIPYGVTEVEKKAVKDLALNSGASEITLLLKPVAAAIGAGLEVEEPFGSLIVDIGGGTTEVSVISMAGIVFSHSIRIGGDQMDDAIIQYLKYKYNVLIGLRTAENIKKILGSACPLVSEKHLVIKAQDLNNGIPVKLTIGSEEIREALAEKIFAIIDTIQRILEKTPPELSRDIYEQGILLTGGTALLQQFDALLQQHFGIQTRRVDDPLTTVVNGVGHILTNRKLLHTITTNG